MNKWEKALKKSTRDSLFSSSKGTPAEDVYAQQEQQLLDTEKEVVLDNMHEALSRLEDQGKNIGGELTSHHVLIQEMDGELDDALGTVAFVQRGMERLLGKGNKGKCKCLVCEIVVVVILVLLIVYT